MSVEHHISLALRNGMQRLEGWRSEYERHGDKITRLAHIPEKSLGRYKGRLTHALVVLDCDCDNNNDSIDEDEDDDDDNDQAALVGPVIDAAGAMGKAGVRFRG